jgi:hypothetical protein
MIPISFVEFDTDLCVRPGENLRRQQTRIRGPEFETADL